MAKTIACAVAIGILLLVQVDAGAAQQANDSQAPSAPALRISSGDLLAVTVFDEPDLSGRFRVDERGDITAPLIGRVPVEGETAEEVGTALEKRYVDDRILRLSHTSVTVFIEEYATQGIVVNGEVKTPGLFPALGIRMLNDVISAAGGVTPTASSKVIITHKNGATVPVRVQYNPTALTPVIPRIQVFPGDTITVPRAGIVYVLGNVIRPGGFVLEGRSDMTVERALALAGGTGHAAAVSRTQLVRTLDGGQKEQIVLSLNHILNSKAPDMAMKDGDILYVPTSNAMLVTQQAITSAVGVGGTILVYRLGIQ